MDSTACSMMQINYRREVGSCFPKDQRSKIKYAPLAHAALRVVPVAREDALALALLLLLLTDFWKGIKDQNTDYKYQWSNYRDQTTHAPSEFCSMNRLQLCRLHMSFSMSLTCEQRWEEQRSKIKVRPFESFRTINCIDFFSKNYDESNC